MYLFPFPGPMKRGEKTNTVAREGRVTLRILRILCEWLPPGRTPVRSGSPPGAPRGHRQHPSGTEFLTALQAVVRNLVP